MHAQSFCRAALQSSMQRDSRSMIDQLLKAFEAQRLEDALAHKAQSKVAGVALQQLRDVQAKV